MPPRPVVRAALCAAAVVGAFVLSFLYPEAAVHLRWAGLTLAVAVFLMDPPSVSIRLGRQAQARATEQVAAAARLQEKAHVLDLKDHALRERERWLREREATLDARTSAVLSRENDLHAQWVRLRAEQERLDGRARVAAGEPRSAILLSPEEWLGVGRGASPDEVRQAWVALAKAYHPDRLRGLPPWAREDGERRMRAINEAYAMLRGERTPS